MTWTGTLPTIVAFAKILGTDVGTIRDAVAGVTDPWTSYSPSWTAATSNPSIGNGSISGSYIQSGKLVIATASITMGSTTTYGSGVWRVSMPVTAASSGLHVGSVLLLDSSASTGRRPGVCFLGATTYVEFISTTGVVGASDPFVWATGDILRLSMTYEAA